MPETITIELGDDGAIGTLPEPVQKFLDKRIAEAHRKGAEKAEQKLHPYLADPVELERLRQRDKALADIELQEAERTKQYEKARKLQEETHAKMLDDAVKAEKSNTQRVVARLKDGIGKTIRAEARALGARAESLDELERLLAVDVDLDADLNPFVVDAKDRKSPRLDGQGKSLTIEGLVADYLKTHPHHMAAAPAQGGRAPGGASLAGGRLPALDDRSRLFEDIEKRGTVDAVARGFAALTRSA